MTIIVSGLERSGTSLMMQILEDAGYDLCYDEQRKPDEHNPNGYYELSDGKIILELMDNEFDIGNYKDKVIKITAYGLHMLESNNYKVIYMKRDLDEVISSQRKMIYTYHRFTPTIDDKKLLKKIDNQALNFLKDNKIDYMVVDYNKLMDNPRRELNTVSKFLGKNIIKSMRVIDKNLYRNRRS